MWSDWSREDFLKALDANMLTPIALMQAVLPGMMAQGWGRVVNITSVSVKAPIATLGLSNSARAGLTGFVAGTARQVAGKGITINNLLPGIHATDRAIALDGAVVKARGISSGAGDCRTQRHDPRRALWHGGGVRGHLRLPVFAACRVHRRPEHPAGRRGHQRDAVILPGKGRADTQSLTNSLEYHARHPASP
jgi:NAD(P)-dependent dehydrogenase (short-subunit alcohol dehydrogenase family)